MEYIFRQVLQIKGRIDWVLHLAAYYDFESVWSPAYDLNNIQGTRNVVTASIKAGVRRFLFENSF